MSIFRLTVFCLFFLLFTCSENQKFSDDISNIEVSHTQKTFLPGENGLFTNEELASSDSVFTDLYINQVLGIASMERDDRLTDLNEVFADEWVKELSDTIRLEYASISDIRAEFEKALRYMKLHFPEKQTPNIYYCNTLFNYQRFLFQDSKGDALGIGLDMFLKKYYDYKLIDPQNPAFSDYITVHFDREHIVPKGMILLIEEIMGQDRGKRFIDQMIENGKKWYMLQRFMPDKPLHQLFDFTPEQLDWCLKNEFDIWSFFNSEKLIYENSPVKIAKYLNESPNSPGMPDAAPGRTASFIGWKIVTLWMDKTNSTLKDLVNKKDAQALLDEVRYRPKRA